MLTQNSKEDIFKLDIKNVCKHFAEEQRKSITKDQLDKLSEMVLMETIKCL
jgi:hypothetical protein